MKKKIIIASIILILIIGIVYYYYTKSKNKIVVDETKNPIIKPVLATPSLNASNDDFPLKIGSKGENVTYLQSALKKMGANIIVDGDFGQQTYSAVLLKVNSSSYPVTIEKFNAILKKANSL